MMDMFDLCMGDSETPTLQYNHNALCRFSAVYLTLQQLPPHQKNTKKGKHKPFI